QKLTPLKNLDLSKNSKILRICPTRKNPPFPHSTRFSGEQGDAEGNLKTPIRWPVLEFIPIKPLVATGSDGLGSYAGHSRFPSRDRGHPPSTGGSGPSRSEI